MRKSATLGIGTDLALSFCMKNSTSLFVGIAAGLALSSFAEGPTTGNGTIVAPSNGSGTSPNHSENRSSQSSRAAQTRPTPTPSMSTFPNNTNATGTNTKNSTPLPNH